MLWLVNVNFNIFYIKNVESMKKPENKILKYCLSLEFIIKATSPLLSQFVLFHLHFTLGEYF